MRNSAQRAIVFTNINMAQCAIRLVYQAGAHKSHKLIEQNNFLQQVIVNSCQHFGIFS
jgi:hypothetical protein